MIVVLTVRRKRGFTPLSFGSCGPRGGRVSRTPSGWYRGIQCYTPFPYGSRGWKLFYNKRVSVERVFGRLKGSRKLDALRTRRLPKVWLHVALSLLTMNAAAVASWHRSPATLRKCVA